MDRLRACIESGRGFEHLYAPDAVLEARLPGGPRRGTAAEMTPLLEMLLDGPGEIMVWRDAAFGPSTIEFERTGRDGSLVRQMHWIATDDSSIVRHLVFSARPQAGRFDPDVTIPALLADAAERGPLAHDGVSGASLEWAALRDGQRLIVKRIAQAWDWVMRATDDPGREATLWLDGTLARLPPEIDCPFIAAEPEGVGWAIAMRDVAAHLVTGRLLTLHDSEHVLRAYDAIHRVFAGATHPHACTLADRYRLFSPATAARELDGLDITPKLASAGWDRFASVLPADLVPALESIHADPGPLAGALAARPCTLIHGDARLQNVGLAGDRVVMLDWGLVCEAPPAVEFTFYLMNNPGRVAATKDQLVDQFRAVSADTFDQAALDLAMIGELAGAWHLPLAISEHPDNMIRVFMRSELDWWADRVRVALDHTWSPV